jgi:hypothetical protein
LSYASLRVGVPRARDNLALPRRKEKSLPHLEKYITEVRSDPRRSRSPRGRRPVAEIEALNGYFLQLNSCT